MLMKYMMLHQRWELYLLCIYIYIINLLKKKKSLGPHSLIDIFRYLLHLLHLETNQAETKPDATTSYQEEGAEWDLILSMSSI